MLGLLLGGCGAAESLVGKFGGDSDEVLPGKREAVMQPNSLGVSDSQSSEPVVVPPRSAIPSGRSPGASPPMPCTIWRWAATSAAPLPSMPGGAPTATGG
jgi:hypothetical protein